MTTFRLTLAVKRDRARIAAVARPKAREETPKKGRHARRKRNVPGAYRSGQCREVRAFGKAEVALDRHAATSRPRCNATRVSFDTPSIPSSRAAFMILGQYSIGIEFRRFISDAVEAFFPMIAANFVLPSKAEMRSPIVYMQQGFTHIMLASQHD